MQTLLGTYLYSALPPASTVQPGTLAHTFDQGPVYASGSTALSTGAITWVPVGSSLVSTIKSAIAASLGVNGVTVQPLTAPPAWVASTTYFQGQAVTNGANIYVLLSGTVSAASGGPTGTGSAPITDNLAIWYYWGPTFTSSPQAPVITNVAFGSRYTGLYWTTNLNTYGIGTRIQDSSNFLFYGSQGTDGAGTNGYYAWNANALIGGVSFMTDAPQFQIVIPSNTGPSIAIFVNGVPVTVGMSFYATGNQFCQLVFPDRRPRLITVEMQTNLIPGFYGVLMNDTSHVWAPAPPISFSMSFVGTSYLDGSGNHPVTASLGLASQIARYLGVSNYWIDRLGSGTGYVNNGGTNYIFGDPVRLNAMVATNPQLLMICGGGINDQTAGSIVTAGAASAAAYQIEYSAALSYYKAVRKALPSTIILVVGAESGATGPSAAIFNMEAAVAAAVVAMNDPYILFIPQSSTKTTSAMISGTGNAVTTNGTGNSDYLISADNIHPVQLGVNELAFQIANAARKAISALN